MAGAGLIAIKRRIKSVTNTKKITKAMGLVATSKLKRSRGRMAIVEEYHNSLEKTTETILNALETKDHSFIKGNKSDKKLYIILTSDTGLCGGYNGLIISSAIESIREDRENSLIIIVGQKGRGYIKKSSIDTIAEYVEIPDIPTIKESGTLFNHAIKLYNNEEVGEVNVVYNKFISPVKQLPVVERILPLSVGESEFKDDLIIEPSPKAIAEDIMLMYLKSKIYLCMMSGKCSEHSARMTAMDGATKNANDILDKLKLQYNRIRQSAITQEISEIVGGAEAQK